MSSFESIYGPQSTIPSRAGRKSPQNDLKSSSNAGLLSLVTETATPAAFAEACSRDDMPELQWRPARHLSLLSRYLVDLANRAITHLIVTMPPRHGKSTLISHYFPAWYLGNFPNHRVILASYGSEFAEEWGSKARTVLAVNGPRYFGVQPNPTRRAVNKWDVSYLDQRPCMGHMRSVGVRGPITGKGCELLIIDDPIKNDEEAESEVLRNKTYNWYTKTAYTRLEPNGIVVIMMCMTGDTPVLMASGYEKPLRDICVGDIVATYDNGTISTSTVLNWANQGPDRVYEIRMQSGITVKANSRHPFLVKKGSETIWRRTAELQKDDALLRVVGFKNAQQKDVADLQSAKVCARHTTTSGVGRQEFERHRLILNPCVRYVCDTATRLNWQSMSVFSPSKMVFALFANNHRRKRILAGMENSLLTTAIIVDESEDCFATIATLWSATENRRQSLSQPLSTCEVVEDAVVEVVEAGIEDVFDIQIDRTENFIANGLVSHNTRWHEDDLVGRLLDDAKKGGTRYETLNLPDVCESPEPPYPYGVGRQPGEPLWPSQWPLEKLYEKEVALGPRGYAALYRQHPTLAGAGLFNPDDFQYLDSAPRCTRYVRSWDLASTAEFGSRDPDWTAGALIGVDEYERIIILDLAHFRGHPATVEQNIAETARMDGPGIFIRMEQEPAGGKTVIHYFQTRVLQSYVVEGAPSTKAKALRATPLSGQVKARNVYLIRAPWNHALCSEFRSFPTGKHDDIVDAVASGYNFLFPTRPASGAFAGQRSGLAYQSR